MASFVTTLALMGAAGSCGGTQPSSPPTQAPHPSHSQAIATPDAPCPTAGAKATGLDGVTYVCAYLAPDGRQLMWLPSDTAGNSGPTAHMSTHITPKAST